MKNFSRNFIGHEYHCDDENRKSMRKKKLDENILMNPDEEIFNK